ncbi:GPI mannosyltransferase, partial [Jimgerdemannia flammicorona]
MEPTTALRIYLALLLARLLAAFLPGYIHPDEFFQSPEITAGVVFAYDVFTPWEFSPEQPSRSIVLPYLTTGIPFELLKLAGELAKKYGFFASQFLIKSNQVSTPPMPSSSPNALLSSVSPSLSPHPSPSSTTKDDSVIRLHGLTGGRDPLPALLALSSSHVMLIYHTRPFSNAVESVLLTLSFYLLFRASTSYSIKVSARTTGAASAVAGTAAPNGYGEDARSADENAGQSGGFFAPWTIALGWVFALGFFSRITFVLYGFPVGLAFLYLTIRNAAEQDGVLMHPVLRLSKLGAFLSDIIPLAFGITSMAAVCVLVDSLYFGHLAVLLADNIVTLSDLIAAFMNDPKSLLELSLAGAPTITPLNNFLYNLDASNLASHGLHPRYLHIAVNLPLLFGPLALLAAYAVVRSALTFRFSAEKLSTTGESASRGDE